MTLLNKLAVSKTRAPVAVVIVQMLATCLVAAASCDLQFGNGWRQWAVSVPLLFVLMMVSSMLALQYVTVGTFVVVRNLGPVFTLFVETAIHRPDKLAVEGSVLPDWRALASTTAIALGVWMYEAHDVQFSAAGLFFLLLNLVLACAERMLQRHFLAVQKVEVSKPALMLLNNGIGAALALVVLLVMSPKEAKLLYHAMRHKPGTGLAVAASCLLGCAISYTGLWLQRLVTATSFMVLGSLTKLMVIAWGIVFLGDASGFLSIMGAAISVGGGFAYAHAISSKKS
jgi:drug/metabolite transporter (DMT)-like permease